jgi:lipid kinase YegS
MGTIDLKHPTRHEHDRIICVIVNGRAALDPQLHTAVAQVRERGHRVEVRVTWEPGDAQRFAAEAAQTGIDTIVAAGGDGTLHEVVNGVVAADRSVSCALGVLPLGTANDFATACGIPTSDRLDALVSIAEGTPTPIDIGRLGEHVFINVASGGFGTQVTVETPPEIKRLLGAAAYFLTGLRYMTDLQARHARLVAPEFTWEGAFYALAVGNGRRAGGGFHICPRALLDDGLLDVVIIPDMPRARLLTLLGDLRRGTHLDDPRVIYLQVPWLKIEASEPLQINLDGEPVHGDAYDFQRLLRHIPFYLPPTAPLQHQSRIPGTES